MEGRYLIAGLGNPGKTYEKTRHNIGFRVVKALAKKYGMTLRPSLMKAKGSLGIGKIEEHDVVLLLPLTYMNESGAAIKKCMSSYKVPFEQLIIVTDDVDLPLGSIRLRAKGSCGGHNGLKSIESHLKTQSYPRLRIGVGRGSREELKDYVLEKFAKTEEEKLPEIIDRAVLAIELWVLEGIEEAMQQANRLGEK